MQTPALKTLISVYYHEDFESIWGAFDDYMARSTEDERDRLVAEIGQVLGTIRDDSDIDQFLDTLGNSADMSATPGGYRGWLEEIARRVRAHLGD